MLEESKCHKRKCIHFLGIVQPDGTEKTEDNFCDAFPEGIPFEIAYGKNKHLKPLSDQDNDIIFEEE